jgi:hypothetical protein
MNANAQHMEIFTTDGNAVSVRFISDSEKKQLMHQFKGEVNEEFRKDATARTYLLNNEILLIEFYDRSGVIINSKEDFKKLTEVVFVKNYIEFLKKDISYKIALSKQKTKELLNSATKLRYSSSMPDYYDFEVFQMSNGQVLFIDKGNSDEIATVYKDIKALASDRSEILGQHYGTSDAWDKKFVAGDTMEDYSSNEFLIEPNEIQNVMINHKLELIERNLPLSHFHSDLYKSEKGYYITIEVVKQKNGTGSLMPILNAQIFKTISEVRNSVKEYSGFNWHRSEHFYKQISDRYRDKFAENVDGLLLELPLLLNFDPNFLTFDEKGIEVVDEAIRWNHKNHSNFNRWYPSVLAFYGECLIKNKGEGRWESFYDDEEKIWIPKVILNNGSAAFDVMSFYKSLYEWPTPLMWAGENWDGKWGK